MDVYSLDALIMPSAGSFMMPAILGTPVVTVPMGSYGEDADVDRRQGDLVDEGRKWSEERLISYAYVFEERTNIRKRIKPYLRLKAELWLHGTQGRGYRSLQAQKILTER